LKIPQHPRNVKKKGTIEPSPCLYEEGGFCVAKDGRSEKLPQSKSEILPAPSEMEPKKAVDFRQPLNGEKIVN